MASSENGATTEVRVCFVTKDATIRVTETPFAVPVNLTRYGLSQVINHLLQSGDGPIPFDFLVANPRDRAAPGELLRTPLSKHMRRIGVSAESTLTLEYLPAVKEPDEGDSIDMPDWVSALASPSASSSASGGGGGGASSSIFTATAAGAPPAVFVSGCYDGNVRLHDGATGAVLAAGGEALASPGGLGEIKAVAAAALADGALLLAGGGLSQRVGLWRAARTAVAGSSSWTMSPLAVGAGHSEAVSCVDIQPDTKLVLSGSWDGNLMLWDGAAAADGSAAAEDGADAKRRRTSASSSSSSSSDGIAMLRPLQILAEHAQRVTALRWLGTSHVASGSHDHSVRLWDVGQGGGVCTRVLHGNKVVTSLAAPRREGGGAEAATTLATGHPDHVVRLWDARAAASSVVSAKLSSHAAAVSSVSWVPGSEFLLASASHDGNVKLWDVRGTMPLHTLVAHEGAKALAVLCDGNAIVSGGSDSKVRLFHRQ